MPDEFEQLLGGQRLAYECFAGIVANLDPAIKANTSFELDLANFLPWTNFTRWYATPDNAPGYLEPYFYGLGIKLYRLEALSWIGFTRDRGSDFERRIEHDLVDLPVLRFLGPGAGGVGKFFAFGLAANYLAGLVTEAEKDLPMIVRANNRVPIKLRASANRIGLYSTDLELHRIIEVKATAFVYLWYEIACHLMHGTLEASRHKISLVADIDVRDPAGFLAARANITTWHNKIKDDLRYRTRQIDRLKLAPSKALIIEGLGG